MGRADTESQRRELKTLEEELADRQASLPAHSLRPAQLREIEELEERIKELKARLPGA